MVNHTVPVALRAWAKEKGLYSHHWVEVLTPVSISPRDAFLVGDVLLSFVLAALGCRYYVGAFVSPLENKPTCYWLSLPIG